jgi:hypothetical protein
MDIQSAQQDVRTAYLRGSVAQAIVGLFWLAAAALGIWGSPYYAILLLVLAVALTLPLTLFTLHLTGRPMGLPGGHPMDPLLFKIALIISLSLLLIAPITRYNLNWFFPAFMFVLGTHYILFIFLYGMWEFSILTVLLMGGGVATALLLPDAFPPGALRSGSRSACAFRRGPGFRRLIWQYEKTFCLTLLSIRTAKTPLQAGESFFPPPL